MLLFSDCDPGNDGECVQRSCNVLQPLSVNCVPFCWRTLKPAVTAFDTVSSQQWPAITMTTDFDGNFTLAASLYPCSCSSASSYLFCERADRGEEEEGEESGNG